MATKGLAVFCSAEVELLACRKAVEFAADAGFSEFIIESDNNTVMHAISSSNADESLLGNVVGDIQQMLGGLHWMSIDFTRRCRPRARGWGEQSGSCVSSIFENYYY